MRTIHLFLIAFGQALALVAAVWQVAMNWGALDGGPTWRWETPVAIALTWLLAVVMLAAAWKLARGRSTDRWNLIGLTSSAMGVSIWFQEFYRMCWGGCRAHDEDATWLSIIAFPAPSAAMTLGCAVLIVSFFRALWRSRQVGADVSAARPAAAAQPDYVTGSPARRLLMPAWLAIVIGAAVGNGIGYAMNFLISYSSEWTLVVLGMPPAEAYRALYQSTSFLIPSLSLSGVALAIGGYWTAWFSGASALRNAMLAGLLIDTLTALAIFVPYETPLPWWARLIAVGIPIPAYLMGALTWKHFSVPSLTSPSL